MSKTNNIEAVRSRLLRGGGVVFLGKIISAVSLLVVNALLARLLEPEEYGAYFLTLSVVTMAAMVGQLGLNRAIVKLVAEALVRNRAGQAKWVIRKSLFICFCCACSIGALLYFGLGSWLADNVFHSKPMGEIVSLISVWVVIFSLQGLTGEIFRGLHKIAYATLFSGLCTGVLSALSFAVIWMLSTEANIGDAVTVSILAGLSSLIIANCLLYKDLAPHKGKSSIEVGDMLVLAMPMFIAGFVLVGVREMHMWVLGAIQPEGDVALYGACARLMTLLTMPLLIVNAILPATVTELSSKGEHEKLQEVLRNSATLASVPTVLGFLLVLAFGSQVLDIVFGNYYIQAYNLLVILAAVALVDALIGSPGVLLMMGGHERVVMRFALLTGLLGIISSIILINSFGVVGVGIGVGIGIVSHKLCVWQYARKKLGTNTHGGWPQLVNMARWAMQYLQQQKIK